MKSFFRTLLFLTLLVFGFQNFADEPAAKPFNRKIYVAGVGNARVVYRIPGEPISSPAKFEVYISCGRSKSERLLRAFGMCELEDYHFDAENKSIVIKFTQGRVDQDTGETFCDNTREEEIGLDVCDPY